MSVCRVLINIPHAHIIVPLSLSLLLLYKNIFFIVYTILFLGEKRSYAPAYEKKEETREEECILRRCT